MTTSYGRDVYCDTSLRTGRYATGLRLVAQNCAHRLETPRGMLQGGEEEQDYGLDLPGLIGSVANEADAAALPGKIRNELAKDPRVVDVTSTVTPTVDGPATTWTVAITVETAEGDFTLAASAVTVAIVGLGEGA